MFIIAIIASKGSVAAGLLSCDTLETVMHYHQNPYVRNITGLHRNYEHKRQIKAIKDCFITWKMI